MMAASEDAIRALVDMGFPRGPVIEALQATVRINTLPLSALSFPLPLPRSLV